MLYSYHKFMKLVKYVKYMLSVNMLSVNLMLSV